MSATNVRWPLPPAFTPVKEIGAGAASSVCEAVQRSTGRPVALKMLTGTLDDDSARRRFTRECSAMAALAGHPHIVTILDAGIHDGRPWIAMELCSRGSLAQAGALDVPAALDVLVAVAEAMDVAHGQGILHCDLKPANILITDYGAAAVGDFGIARPAGATATAAGSGYSLDHAAPEILDGHEPTTATDVYGLGTTIWALLSGRPPFRDDAATPASAVIRRILLDPLPAAPPHTPPALAELIDAMTAKAPDDRIGSMADVAERGRSIRAEVSGPAPVPTSSHGLPVVPLPRPAPEYSPELTVLRPRRGAAAVPPGPGGHEPEPRPGAPLLGSSERRLVASVGAVLLVLVALAALAVAGVLPRPGRAADPPAPPPVVSSSVATPSAPPTASSAAPVASPAPSAEPVDDLGLGVAEADPECDGSYILIVGSAVTPGRYATDVAALLAAHPGSHYVRTARSCGSFQDRMASGDLIYAVYLGPYADLDEACAARASVGLQTMVRQVSDTAPTTFPVC